MEELIQRLAAAEARIEKMAQAIVMLTEQQPGAAREIAREVLVEVSDQRAEAGG